MQEVLMQLIATARLHDSVASNTLDGGFQIIAYPENEVVLIAMGYAHSAPQRTADALLRKRSSDLARYGDWLPTIFDDRNWYVVRRLAADEADSGLTDDELEVAWELLN